MIGDAWMHGAIYLAVLRVLAAGGRDSVSVETKYGTA